MRGLHWTAWAPDVAELEQVLRGVRPARHAHPTIRREAVRRLTDEGLSAREIGERIGAAERTVVRWRSTLVGAA